MTMNNRNIREVLKIIDGQKTSDGDGVQLTRLIGTAELNLIDPFLLMDAFGSDKPLDNIGGFPSHPHRGFETVTYMLAGKMRHKDSAGNAGVIAEGGVQWMTAGKGIIHSEMPEQQDGLLSGLQLWVNLPQSVKMTESKYQEYSKDDVPLDQSNPGYSIRVIAGKTQNGVNGVIENSHINPIYWDVKLHENRQFKEIIPAEHNAFLFVLEGNVYVGESQQLVNKGQLALLDMGEALSISSNTASRFIVIAGKPLNEPIARGGPFVMNSQEEIQQAFNDYNSGNLV
ncbi:MAG: pirin family protein [Alcanivoracaceae bacterium]|nr:pirin family protein [Alcanivoracaceae bacterium]